MLSSKDEFLRLRDFERVFGKADEFLQEWFKDDKHEVETEEFEIVKGNYKTTLIIRFNKSGYPISSFYKSKYEPSETEIQINELKSQLSKALTAKDYLKCHDLQGKLDKLKNQQETNKNK